MPGMCAESEWPAQPALAGAGEISRMGKAQVSIGDRYLSFLEGQTRTHRNSGPDHNSAITLRSFCPRKNPTKPTLSGVSGTALGS